MRSVVRVHLGPPIFRILRIFESLCTHVHYVTDRIAYARKLIQIKRLIYSEKPIAPWKLNNETMIEREETRIYSVEEYVQTQVENRN